jgi:hypothetical protein
MGTVRTWWQKILGREPPPAPAPKPAARKAPQASGLQLADDADAKQPSRVGAAGFDPYSSDAGYSKPHSWERVDHD